MTGPDRQPPTLVSVVIPCRNVVDWIDAQLAALAAQDYPGDFEVVLADNGSTDGLEDHLRPWHDRFSGRLEVVDCSDIAGVAHARNSGCRSAKGELLLVCDADDVVDSHWISAMVNVAITTDVVGGSLKTDELNDEIVRQWRSLPEPGKLPLAGGFLPYAQGCNVAVWRDVFDYLDGWDITFVGGADDVEFSWRAQLAGYQIRPAADAVIQYRLRSSARQTMKQSYAYALNDGRLLQTFESSGMTARPFRHAVVTAAEIVIRFPGSMFDAGRRGRWLSMVGSFAGRAVSSVRYRRWAF